LWHSVLACLAIFYPKREENKGSVGHVFISVHLLSISISQQDVGDGSFFHQQGNTGVVSEQEENGSMQIYSP
jgi:hypothetical protein